MGQVITKDMTIETANYNDIRSKFAEMIKQLNELCKDIGMVRVYYQGDLINTDSLIYFYVNCMYLDNNSHMDEEVITNCTNQFTLMVQGLDGKIILNPGLQKYISNILNICTNLCSAIPNCKSLSYNLISMQSVMPKPHPIGFSLIIYPIIS